MNALAIDCTSRYMKALLYIVLYRITRSFCNVWDVVLYPRATCTVQYCVVLSCVAFTML